MAIGEEVDFFFREIDRGLDIDPQADQLLGEVMHPLGKRPLQGSQCVAGRLRGARFNQIGNRLGLGQVEFVVEKGPFTEFPRSRQATAQLEATLEQHVQDNRAAVALQFQYIFAGE